jgi:hypothetical protein
MSAGYFFSSVLFQLPMVAVLVIGIVLIGSRRALIGSRSALLAQAGLGVLIVEVLLQTVWTVLFPQLVSSLDSSVTQIGVVSSAIGLLLSALVAAGVGLLIAALLARVHQPPVT